MIVSTLKAGKIYKARGGQTVEILRNNGSWLSCWTGKVLETGHIDYWREYGIFNDPRIKSHLDLIAEIEQTENKA